MTFNYTTELIDNALTYADYRKLINETLSSPPIDAAAEKMRHYVQKNVVLMDEYDNSYRVSPELLAVVTDARPATWLVITEPWCGDAAFNVPMFHALEQVAPEKIKVRVVLRDSNLDLIDANLTDGGRSIPKLVVLSETLVPVGHWGPRPAGLQELMKQWKNDGLELKQIIPKVHDWYRTDETNSLQQELISMIKHYPDGN